MAESRVRAWLSTSDNRWRNGAPKSARPGTFNVPMGNVRAVRVEGPDPDTKKGTRWYTLRGPFPGHPNDLEDWLDEWIETNYGEFR